ncbi:MAG TPA: polyprenyl synthetase family protein [Gemmatimonadaceae bacterium]|jgi:octaprenyl-diphosphate synthase|nr:polyprenyl synthetase family protein [Gemmatimonadaceae bacterium]
MNVAAPRGASLQAIQIPVRSKLDDVSQAMATIVASKMPLVGQVSAHLLAMRGKLFRPTLLLLSSQVEGGKGEAGSGKREAGSDASGDKAVSLAAALELIHLATLVHDDAVDHSALRRGMPTVNALFSHQISVIMGDFLYSTALTHLVGLGDLAALQALTRASTEMTLGEMRQLAVTEPLQFTEGEYYDLIRSKTASLMRTACELGALAGARSHEKALGDFGENLGMAFQITDDLLDYREVKETTGKPSGLDLREHKVTLPLIHALREMSPASRKEVERLFATETVSDDEIAAVVQIVADNGGFEYARKRGEEFAERAHDALSELPDTVARRSLSASISYVMERHS